MKTPLHPFSSFAAVACAAALPDDLAYASSIGAVSAGQPVDKVQLLPIGPIKSKRDGRSWRVRDLAHAQAIAAATNATADPAEIPIDFDHQLMATYPNGGGTASAAGWMRNVRAEADGIYADVEWTAAARAKLEAREYRYISPVFAFDKATGDVSRILHAGLTNFPAITELAAVASATQTGDSMDLKALAAALGLSADATLEQIVAAAGALNARLGAIAAAAGLKPDASNEEIAAAGVRIAAGVVDPTKFAPISELVAANARIKALEDKHATDAASAAVDQAVAAGKITPANKDWALGYATKDLAGFNAFVGNAPVVAAAAASTTTAAAPTKVEELTADQIAACKATGVSPEAFLKTLKEEVAHGRA